MESLYKNQIETFCPHCKELQQIVLGEGWEKADCSHCCKALFQNTTEALLKDQVLNQCPACGCTHLYRQKDFNRRIGMIILLAGIALSFFTYGISLLVVTFIDLLFYFKVKEVGVCYQCSAIFRGFKTTHRLPPFHLTLHDHYRLGDGG